MKDSPVVRAAFGSQATSRQPLTPVGVSHRGLPRGHHAINQRGMPESAEARIEQALARIEAAARTRAFAAEKLARRHARLREKMAEAVASLDALVARASVGETSAEDE